MRIALVVTVLAFLVAAARADVAIDALRATVRIEHDGNSGTAFVVALPAADGRAETRLLVTAAHVLENMKGDSCTAAFRARGGSGFVRRDARLPIRADRRTLWVRHPEADVAVIEVEPPADADLGALPVDRLADAAAFERGDVRAGQRTLVACFPAKTEANAAGWPVLRAGTIATHPLAPVTSLDTFFVDYSHFGGDSGAAVVVERDAAPLVVGIVVSMQRQTDRVTSPFEDKKVHTPLGLGIAVPADRVRATIDRWRERPGEPAAAGAPGSTVTAP
jgi:hypothetical protein